MADDINPALRAELNAALAIIDPQIRGLRDLLQLEIATADLHNFYQTYFERFSTRRNLIIAALAALDAAVAAMTALEADGYPTVPEVLVDPPIFDEMSGEMSDMEAAFKLFTEKQLASKLSVNLGTASPKPASPTFKKG